MKNIHLRKLLAVMEVKSKTLLDKTYIIMPLFSIGFAFLMRFMSSVYMEGGKVSPSALANCVIMNICMCSIFCVAGSLAEERKAYIKSADDFFSKWDGILSWKCVTSSYRINDC